MTHRQYAAWCRWRGQEWNRPSRTDSYLMQIACEVRRVLSKNPNGVKIKHFELKFGTGEKPQDGGLTKEQATEASKSLWLSRMGGASKVRVVNQPKGLQDPPEPDHRVG
jgi:hypothetical protein